VRPWDHGNLQVTANKKYLAVGSKPFFWLGDTAWLMLEKLIEDEMYIYLKNRQQKHFNVIQATLIHRAQVLAQYEPFFDNDLGRPNPDSEFWTRVDRAIAMADELGLYMALLPTWGGWAKSGKLNLDNVEAYSSFLADRYGKYQNVIWLTGGDIRGNIAYDLYMKLGALLKERCPGQLVGFHPFGRTSSSLWFNDAPWLDFNMFQSGHRRYDQSSLGEWDDNKEKEGFFGEDSWRYVERDHATLPLKPTLDGEPSYEQIPQGLHDPSQPYWQDHDVRRYAYWSVFAGACGHTYGHNAVMQMFREQDNDPDFGVKSYWHQAIHDPGAGQMAHLYELMTAVEFSEGEPKEELLADGQKPKYERIAVFAGRDYAYFYSYLGTPFRVNMDKLLGSKVDAYWFDPAAGIYSYFGALDCRGVEEFVPPVKPAGHNDWVLVLRNR
jgi:hypothetical protein